MTILGGLGFTAPWLLLGLGALPILWFVLRAIPPAPIRRKFPGVALLLGLTDEDSVSDRTPWWLLLLRMLAVALMIVGFSGPTLNPKENVTYPNPLLILFDGSWANADQWKANLEFVSTEIETAGRASQPVAIVQLTHPEKPVFQTADAWQIRLSNLTPMPWLPTQIQINEFIQTLDTTQFDTLWISDSLNHAWRNTLLAALETYGQVRVLQSTSPLFGLTSAKFDSGIINVTVVRSQTVSEQEINVLAIGTDPTGTERILGAKTANFKQGDSNTQVNFDLPIELGNRITRFEIQTTRSAGAITLTDDNLRRREIVIVTVREEEGPELLSQNHYLERALSPSAEIFSGALLDLIPANPDVVILADVVTLTSNEETALTDWVKNGGTLLRFAGPRLAASNLSRVEEHPLMPVRLRAGGRRIGGTMSWGEPKKLSPFDITSPFFRLSIPDDVTVTTQVMAQPDPRLSERVITSLSDGTPLVTRKFIDQGQVILFHISANAEWSNLPLSGLFVKMLERLSISRPTKPPNPEDLESMTWSPNKILDGFGHLNDATNKPGVDGAKLISGYLGPDFFPGIYQHQERRIARNVLKAGDQLELTEWPSYIKVESPLDKPEISLGGLLLACAIAFLFIDVVATLALSGRLFIFKSANAVSILLALTLILTSKSVQASDNDELAMLATSELILAYVVTDNPEIDNQSKAGLMGLSKALFNRTSVEPGNPIGLNLEHDDLSFFPLLYWPITPTQPTPSAEAYLRLNAYLRSGGMIVFDTRDADIPATSLLTPNKKQLRNLTKLLDIPPLEPLLSDHVLTRTFYLLQDFPGRYISREIWVEAMPSSNAQQIDGITFHTLNDGVSPVIIGGNDWAGAWAVDNNGRPLLPISRGFAEPRQRELALRFGVNLVMYALTGNYKSDQVHIPALLDRLGLGQ
ncbi:MAG: DUF4159 domain-containing protein [Aestuariivita sp.]|nr:DUF4159 domain-containing protein [Aestuariivita sp.]